jgi:SAM-dependent methyltransferase
MNTQKSGLKLLYVVLPLLLVAIVVRYVLMLQPTVSNEDTKPAGWSGINAPFITSSEPSVAKMIELAEIKPEDVVYDLGCGDGRLVIAAVASSGCRGVGIDIEPELIKESIENATRQSVVDKIEFREQDIFQADLRECSVALIYLTGWMIEKLEPQFEQMKPGSRIVSQDYYIQQVRPHRVIKISTAADDDPSNRHTIYFYKTPLQRDPKMERNKPPQPADALDSTP